MGSVEQNQNGTTNGTTTYPPGWQSEPVGMQKYMAPNLYQPHNLRQAIRDAHARKIPCLLGWFNTLTSVDVNRFVAPMGWDLVGIDWEHSSLNVETMQTIVRDTLFMSQGKTIPFVRVPGHDHAAIGYVIDAGASVMVPQVETVEEAQHVVSATKFGFDIKGTRSAPPFAWVPGLTNQPLWPEKGLYRSLNDQAAVIIQVETLKAIENLDAILTEVKDIDAVWLGKLDAQISMGFMPSNPGDESEDPAWIAAKKLFFDTIKKHDIPYAGGAFFVEDFAEATKDQAFSLIQADAMALMGMMNDLGKARGDVAKTVGGKKPYSD